MRTYIIIMSLFFMLSACGNQSGGQLEGRNGGGGGVEYDYYPSEPPGPEDNGYYDEFYVDELTDEIDSLKSVLSEINSLASDALDSENIEEIYDILEEIQNESQ